MATAYQDRQEADAIAEAAGWHRTPAAIAIINDVAHHRRRIEALEAATVQMNGRCDGGSRAQRTLLEAASQTHQNSVHELTQSLSDYRDAAIADALAGLDDEDEALLSAIERETPTVAVALLASRGGFGATRGEHMAALSLVRGA